MTSRTASKMVPPSWKTKPIQENSISPALAMATPHMMRRTFPRVLKFGVATPQAHEAMRTATGPVDLSIWMKATER